MSMMCGGTSETKPVDETVTALANKVRKSLEEKVGKEYTTYEPVSHKTQIVAGVNYFVKVKVGDGDFVHLRIYEHLPGQGETELTSYQEGKKELDEIEYF